MIGSHMFSAKRGHFPIPGCRFQGAVPPCPHSLRRIREFVLSREPGILRQLAALRVHKLRLSTTKYGFRAQALSDQHLHESSCATLVE